MILTVTDTSESSGNNGRYPQKALLAPGQRCSEIHWTAGSWAIVISQREGHDTHGLPVKLWPDIKLSHGCLGLSVLSRMSSDLALGDSITLELLDLPTLPIASHIVLELLSPLLSKNTLLKEQKALLETPLLMYAKEVLLDQTLIAPGLLLDIPFRGSLHRIRIARIRSASSSPFNQPRIPNSNTQKAFLVSRRSTLSLLVPSPTAVTPEDQTTKAQCGYKLVGGLDKEIQMIKEMVGPALAEDSKDGVFAKMGLKPPRGILLYGPPGTGKTLLARAVAQETGAHVLILNGPEVLSSRAYGETEAKLKSVFQEARDRSPALIFIDEIDALCPRREEAGSELEKRVVATLLTLMDGSSDHGNDGSEKVVIIGATNRPETLDEALRRPGRFDREIEIGIPNANARLQILQTLLSSTPHSLSAKEIEDTAFKTHGYVGADLAALCREAGLVALNTYLSDDASMRNRPDLLKISLSHIDAAITKIRPSAMREIFLEIPKVYWSDIGGQHGVKQKLTEAVEWPLKHPEVFTRFNIKPPKGLLLYGPPGCSKTLLAKALATESKLNFIAIKGPELFSKWVGESEKAIEKVFARARAASPSIIFFDEIDAIAVQRSGDESSSVGTRVLSQLLNEMDGVEALVNVTIIAATNRPDILDAALLRPGRMDRILYVAPPDFATRKEILRIQLSKMSIGEDVLLDKLAERTDGFSGAETVQITQEAGFEAMTESLSTPAVCWRHFESALSKMTPRISQEMLDFYDVFQKRSGLKVL